MAKTIDLCELSEAVAQYNEAEHLTPEQFLRRLIEIPHVMELHFKAKFDDLYNASQVLRFDFYKS
jgi:hypothetical protein